MDGREKVVADQNELDSKKKDKQVELDKMLLGKTTLKSFFKSKSTVETDKVAYARDIEEMTGELEEYRKLVNFITIYHGHMAIEKFK
jgi:cell fate (sporulation/competence/biofilm development) regulator YlbF (YheA/YmcA/DUF963 family)